MQTKPYQIGLYEKAMPASISWDKKLKCAKDRGYDFLEISIDESDGRLCRLNWTKRERMELVKAMYDLGIPIRSMCLSAHRKYPFGASDMSTREHSLEIMREAIRLADDLGIRMIQLAGYDVYYEEGSKESEYYFLENLKIATDLAAASGITLGFETMETEFMNTVSKGMHYVRLINSPYLGIYPDAGNLYNAAISYGTDVFDDLRSGSGHLIAMHLKETVPGKFREIPFLKGHVDFPQMIAEAWALGVRRYVTEMWDIGKPEWEQDIQFAHDQMCKILDTMK